VNTATEMKAIESVMKKMGKAARHAATELSRLDTRKRDKALLGAA